MAYVDLKTFSPVDSFAMQHILSAGQFSRKDLDKLMARAAEMEATLPKGGTEICKGKILAALFYEPSTRTRLSFETAMYRLGGHVISETDVTFSSQTKGEVLPDTIRIIGGYADVIAMRTKEKGSAEIAAQYSPVPILNGGDGPGEHPTQSLLDLYTLTKHFKVGDEKLNIAFVGDLKYGRTVHSLSTLLRHYEGISYTHVAPEALQMPGAYRHEGDDIRLQLDDDVLAKADIIYDTRIQKERFTDLNEYNRLKDSFVFTPDLVSKMKDTAILMHPLPRVNEIELAVDDLPQAAYFEQAINGVPMRMALIAEVLGL